MDCLVTKLKGTVNDSSLPELGTLYFTYKSSAEKLYTLGVGGKGVEIFTPNKESIIHTTNSNSNGVSAYTLTSDERINLYIDTTNEVVIGIRNKYNLTYFDVNRAVNAVINIEDFKYCSKLRLLSIIEANNSSGNISSLSNLTALTYLSLSDTQVSGDISALQNLTALTTLGLTITQVSGDISALQNLTALTTLSLNDTQVSGDISALQNLTALTTLSLSDTQVSGDISALQNLTALTTLYLTITQVSGDISALQNLTALTTFNAWGGGTFTGDFFGKLAEKNWKEFQANGNFTYSTKNYSGKTYGIIGSNNCVCSDLDAFLNDFQNVTKCNRLTVTGTRTSASDAAISALQGKGCTVTVPEATNISSISLMSVRSAKSAETYRIAYKGSELIVEPTTLQIYPASGVTVKEFDSEEAAKEYIKAHGLKRAE